jgi:hypothetical protein
VLDGLNETIELPLIRGELRVARRNQSTEECDWPDALMKHDAEAMARCVTLDYEFFVEGWELKNGHRCQGLL